MSKGKSLNENMSKLILRYGVMSIYLFSNDSKTNKMTINHMFFPLMNKVFNFGMYWYSGPMSDDIIGYTKTYTYWDCIYQLGLVHME